MKNIIKKSVYLIIMTSALLRPFIVVLTVTSSLAAGMFSTAVWADGDGGDGGDGSGDGNGGNGGMLELAAMVTAAMGGMGAKTAEMEGMGGMATGQEMAETAAMQDQVA